MARDLNSKSSRQRVAIGCALIILACVSIAAGLFVGHEMFTQFSWILGGVGIGLIAIGTESGRK